MCEVVGKDLGHQTPPLYPAPAGSGEVLLPCSFPVPPPPPDTRIHIACNLPVPSPSFSIWLVLELGLLAGARGLRTHCGLASEVENWQAWKENRHAPVFPAWNLDSREDSCGGWGSPLGQPVNQFLNVLPGAFSCHWDACTRAPWVGAVTSAGCLQST